MKHVESNLRYNISLTETSGINWDSPSNIMNTFPLSTGIIYSMISPKLPGKQRKISPAPWLYRAGSGHQTNWTWHACHWNSSGVTTTKHMRKSANIIELGTIINLVSVKTERWLIQNMLLNEGLISEQHNGRREWPNITKAAQNLLTVMVVT